jgi:hypothetical protein
MKTSTRIESLPVNYYTAHTDQENMVLDRISQIFKGCFNFIDVFSFERLDYVRASVLDIS